jgi:hypothetical protein
VKINPRGVAMPCVGQVINPFLRLTSKSHQIKLLHRILLFGFRCFV